MAEDYFGPWIRFDVVLPDRVAKVRFPTEKTMANWLTDHEWCPALKLGPEHCVALKDEVGRWIEDAEFLKSDYETEVIHQTRAAAKLSATSLV